MNSTSSGIKRRPALLVGGDNDDAERVLPGLAKQGQYPVQQHPLHPAGIVQGMYAKEEGHGDGSKGTNQFIGRPAISAIMSLTI